MITLEKTFKSGDGGFGATPLIYNQIARNNLIAVYERIDKNGIIKDYETIIIRIIPKGTSIFNAPPSLDDEERYAVSSSWGKGGWSFHGKGGKTASLNKFNELCQKKIDDSNESNESIDSLVKASKIDSTLYVFPMEFSIKDFAEANKIEYLDAFLFIKESVNKNTIKFVREERRAARGKMSKIFAKV